MQNYPGSPWNHPSTDDFFFLLGSADDVKVVLKMDPAQNVMKINFVSGMKNFAQESGNLVQV